MKLPPLVTGHIRKRYKRFLADVVLEDGQEVTAHCPNTGSMTGCWEPGAAVQLSHSDNPSRKLPWTLERVDMGQGWVGVNTGRVNAVVAEGIADGKVSALKGYSDIKSEPRFEAENFPPSRFDLFLSGHRRRADAYVEVKNTTYFDNGRIQFPDAVTTRGRKHLELLRVAVDRGYRGVIVFAINRPEGTRFTAARDVDPEYAEVLSAAYQQGVEVLPLRIRHDPDGMEIDGRLPWVMRRG